MKINSYKTRFILASFLVMLVFVPVITYAQESTNPSFGDYVQTAAKVLFPNLSALSQSAAASISHVDNIASSVFLSMLNFTTYLLLVLVSFLMWIAGLFFNAIFYVSVSNMGEIINSVNAIESGWIIFRDLANIVFIFALLYIAIAKIVQLESVNVNKALRNLIIAALLINFSLFFTKVLVDVSNSLAVSFYNQISTSAGLSDSGFVGFVNVANGGLSGAIMQRLGVVEVWDPEIAFGLSELSLEGLLTADPGQILTKKIAAIFIMLIAILVLLIAAFMFLFRFITIIFLMVLSPFAFAGMILPQTKSLSQKWWAALTDQVLFAPVFILLLYISIDILGSISAAIESVDKVWMSPKSFILGSVGALVSFFVAVGFFLGSIIMAKRFASVGGDASVEGAFKLTRFIGRNALGRPSAFLASEKRLQGMRDSDSKITSTIGRLGLRARKNPLGKLVAKAGPTLGSASFDPRNIKNAEVVSDAIGGLSSALGSNFKVGKGIKDGGIVQLRSKKTKNIVERESKKLETMEEDSTVVIEAEDKLAKAKLAKEAKERELQDKSPKFRNLNKEIKETEEETKDLKEQLTKNPERKAELKPKIAAAKKKLVKAKKDLNDFLTSGVMNKELDAFNAAQEKIDSIKGVSKDEAQKRNIKERKSRINIEKEAYINAVYDRNILQRAIRLQPKSTLGSAKQALLKKMGGKKVEDLVKEALKQNKETSDDKPEDKDENKDESK
ncbi:MAG: type IV secretion system protein [Candidatus Pacebacteria bacterium]|nr:type IV secretion system protein [Candidatus Paceibacterota bacterium]